ncbi:MAG: RDD family protein [Pseudomonadota bacterium]
MITMTHADPYHLLPDPETQPGFYADVPFKRLVAFFIDSVLITAMTLAAVIATLGFAALLFVFLAAVIGFLYRVFTLANRSATWGMALMGIELRRIDGERFTFADATLHTLSFYISFAMMPVQAISIAFMVMGRRGQGLTDMLFGTVALNRRARA